MNANTNLRQQIHESNKNFSFTEFFSYDGRDKHGATGLITPSQALTLLTDVQWVSLLQRVWIQKLVTLRQC